MVPLMTTFETWIAFFNKLAVIIESVQCKTDRQNSNKRKIMFFVT